MFKTKHVPVKVGKQTWHALAMDNTEELTIGHIPALFDFFTGKLKLPAYYFILMHEGAAAGLLPLVRTGKSFISLPHFSYGGILWKKGLQGIYRDEKVIEQIAGHIRTEKLASGFYLAETDGRTAGKLKIDAEVRGLQPLFGTLSASKVVHCLELDTDKEHIFRSFSPNLRRKINKSCKNGLTVRSGGTELLDDFVHVYNRNMHRIGSPSLGKGFFGALLAAVERHARLFVVYKERIPAGGAFAMWYDGYYENTWFSTLHEFNSLYTSYMLHWEMIGHASQLQAKIYSMGRSTKGSGVDNYKSQWPVQTRDVYFSTSTKKAFSLKDQHWMTLVWKRLPAVVVDSLGPLVAQRIY